MNGLLAFALIAFAAAGVFHGLRVRRTSFRGGLALPATEADRQVFGWLAWLLRRSPGLCDALDRASSLLPGPRSDIEGAVASDTTFTGLQSRTILHRYYRWQVHNILRVLCALLFCGVLLVCTVSGLSSRAFVVISLGSGLLCAYSALSWWKLRSECEGTRRVSRGADTGDMVLDAFGELSRCAMNQMVAFALVFACNFGFQVMVLVDPNSLVSMNPDIERAQRLEESFRLDPTAFPS